MALIRWSLVILLVSCSAAGCSSGNQLTRERAASLIAASEGFLRTPVETIAIDAQGLREGQSRRLWTTRRVVVNPGVPNTGWYDDWELTPAGKAHFSKMDSDLMQIHWGGVATGAHLTLQQPAQRRLSNVKGIRGGDKGNQVAAVDFTWQIPTIATDTFTGQATLQLYDDGWRVREVSLRPVGHSEPKIRQLAGTSRRPRRSPSRGFAS